MPDENILPRISENDFPAFRQLMSSELPPDFSTWEERHRARLAEYPQHREIFVTPDAFKRFCDTNGKAYSGMSLLEFAESLTRARR
jgi:hypothetical protein